KVATAEEFAVYVELRNRRPVGVFLDPLADLIVREHVNCKIIGHAAALEDLDDGRREAALRKLRRALHVQHDAVRLDLVEDGVLDAHGDAPLIDTWAILYRIGVSSGDFKPFVIPLRLP